MSPTSLEYVPGKYRGLYGTPLGRALWEFLTEERIRIRMHTACDLGRPALEAVEGLMLERFGNELLSDEVRRMVGHMIRQVVEPDGYRLDAKNIKLVSGGPFGTAGRYKHSTAETFHAWRLSTDPRSIALTLDKMANRLPAPDRGSWIYWKPFAGALRLCVVLGVQDMAKLREALAQAGYYLHTIERVLRAQALAKIAEAAQSPAAVLAG